MASFPFKIPSAIPQDLLLIHDLVGEAPAPHTPEPHPVDDSIASSDSDTDSEREVEADILAGVDEGKDDSPTECAPVLFHCSVEG